jgi:hypothetical protein
MPPGLLRKLLCFAETAKRVSVAAKTMEIPFFSLFLADSASVFGNRQDQDKHEIFVRLSKIGALIPYLTPTVLISLFHGNICNMQFPVVIKPIWGLQSLGIIVVSDRNTFRDFVSTRRTPYIVQPYIQEGVEIGISYTRNPAGLPDFFGVACKEPVGPSVVWCEGVGTVPKYFYHRDLTDVVRQDLLLALCRAVAETLQSNSLRIDAFIQTEGPSFRYNTLKIIDVNTGPFAVDEFLFDPKHSREFVVGQLTRKYTYLLQWGAHYSPSLDFSTIRKWLSHFIYCYLLVLFGHLSEMTLFRRLNVLHFPVDLLRNWATIRPWVSRRRG